MMTERQALLLSLSLIALFVVPILELVFTLLVPSSLRFGVPLTTIRFPFVSDLPSSVDGFVLVPLAPGTTAFRETFRRRTAGAKGTLTLDRQTNIVALRAIVPWSLPFPWLFFVAATQGMPTRPKLLILSVVTVFTIAVLVWQVHRCHVLVGILARPTA